MVARIDYADINVVNTIIGELKNGEHYNIAKVINFILETSELGRGGYSVYNAYTKKRSSTRGDGALSERTSKSDTRGIDANGSRITGDKSNDVTNPDIF